MTFIEQSEKQVVDIRAKQKAFVDCVNKFFDEAVIHVLNERYLKQSFCGHPNMIEKVDDKGNGSRKCPDCGWGCCWGTYEMNPKPPPPYPHESDVEDLLKGLRLL